jgi:nicotinamidase/pyrazinamidase
MRTLFFDVDTQVDFVRPGGALYVPGAEGIVPAVAQLNRWAMSRGIPLISTVDCHAEDDPEFRKWPPHCVAGTLGQRKPEETMVGQIVLNKTTLDCFECPSLAGVLAGLDAERCVVYGVVAEICVRLAAFGLLKTGRRVEIVTDAVKALDEGVAARMFAEFTAAGGVLTTVAGVCR